MTTTRSRWFRPRARTGRQAAPAVRDESGPAENTAEDAAATAPVTPIAPTPLADCLRACAEHCGTLTAAGRGGDHAVLADALAALPGPEDLAGPAGADGAEGADGADDPLTPELLDALLDAGSKALACGPGELGLAVLISDTVLTHRADSRAGWRLRGRVLEATGRTAGAVDAYERYLARTERDSFGVAERVAALSAALRHEQALAGLLERVPAATAGTDTGPGNPVEAMEAAAERFLAGQLAAAERDEGYDPALLTAVAEHYAGQRRDRRRAPLADPTLGGVEWLSLGEFRNLITGRSLCMVANSPVLEGSSLGKEIDSYDLVVRFNSFRIEPADTGERTDIHATGHRHLHNWDRPVDTRLIVCGESADYRHAVRRLVPGAQRRVGDDSVRWPVRAVGRMQSDVWPQVPTTGFNLMWLVDFLDVSPRFDLIGFDFFASGAWRLPEAMRLPVPAAADHSRERAWVMERAQHVNGPVISLR
jgi:hypothetical protein